MSVIRRRPFGRLIRARLGRFSGVVVLATTLMGVLVLSGQLSLFSFHRSRAPRRSSISGDSFGNRRRPKDGVTRLDRDQQPQLPRRTSTNALNSVQSAGMDSLAGPWREDRPKRTTRTAEEEVEIEYLLLTEPESIGEVDKNFSGYVYSMWNEHSFAFSQVAYKNTETLLSLLPNAQFRFLEFCPIQSQGYRIADGLSRMQFTRYSKRGYDIRMRMVNEKWGPYTGVLPSQRRNFPEKTNVGDDRPPGQRAGEAWWRQNRDRFPYNINNHGTLDSVQPHPRDAFFIIMVHLYLTGGLYTDHTVAFNKLDKTGSDQYAIFGDQCGISRSEDSTVFDRNDYNGWDTGLPMFYRFPAPNHPVLQCVLTKFDLFATTTKMQHKLDEVEHFCLSPSMRRNPFPFYMEHVVGKWSPCRSLAECGA